GADAAIVEGDYGVPRGDAVDDPRIPVVEVRGQVVQEDHGYAGLGAELAVRESRATDIHCLGRHLPICLLPRHGHSFPAWSAETRSAPCSGAAAVIRSRRSE